MESDDGTDPRIQRLLWQQLRKMSSTRKKRQTRRGIRQQSEVSVTQTGKERTCPQKRKQPDQHSERHNSSSENEEKQLECSICLEALQQRKTTSLACGHTFHARCTRKAKKYNLEHCPICRR